DDTTLSLLCQQAVGVETLRSDAAGMQDSQVVEMFQSTLSYGARGQNPLERMRFYSPDNPAGTPCAPWTGSWAAAHARWVWCSGLLPRGCGAVCGQGRGL